jgi:hypothetical protein
VRQKKVARQLPKKLSARQKKSCALACPKKFVLKNNLFITCKKNGQPDD